MNDFVHYFIFFGSFNILLCRDQRWDPKHEKRRTKRRGMREYGLFKSIENVIEEERKPSPWLSLNGPVDLTLPVVHTNPGSSSFIIL